ncbi:hypothetical protein A4X06_0g5192 [Tilletia controversa]|uniref:non-specific serine/threonine protein kinase n=1 Tax=Tilletia controversa TaxID=13291 RepID=A0A8X7MRX0_9BASI|nr:hypothetical protein CF328_g4456 [Tilletia controversa]KAE8246095.1 hypothetical protein A4X06_0g5192 [Tilletia controversa]
MPSSSRTGAAGRTYGSKPGGAHRIMRTPMASNWLDEPASSSSFYASRGADTDPLHLHNQRKAAVALAADSSSSAGDGESPSRASTDSPEAAAPSKSKRVVAETPSPKSTAAGNLSISDDDEMANADGDFEPTSSLPPHRPERSINLSLSPSPVSEGSEQSAIESEESEIESPRAIRDTGRVLARPTPSETPSRIGSGNSKSRALLEVLIPQSKTPFKPLPRLNGSAPRPNGTAVAKPVLSENGKGKARAQSPVRTTNGARPTEALAEVIRRSKRPRKSEHYAELSDEAESIQTPKGPTKRMSTRRSVSASASASVPSSPPQPRKRTPSLSRATSEAMEKGPPTINQKIDHAKSRAGPRPSLVLQPGRTPSKSRSVFAIEIPTPTRPSRSSLSGLTDPDATPRPEVRKLRSSIGKIDSSDPDSLRGAHGSSPFKRRRTNLRPAYNHDSDEEDHDDDDDDDQSEEESDEEDESLTTFEANAKEAASLEMSKKDHSIILGPDLKSVDESMATLLSACNQKTFIPFSRVLGLLGASSAPKTPKKGPKSSAAGAGALVKIGEATYSEVFRLTTKVSMRTALGPKNGSKLAEPESWEERKVLKIIPIRKDRPAEKERKSIVPSTVVTTSRSRADSAEQDGATDDGKNKRRGARARAPTRKRGSTADRADSEDQERMRQRKRARERISTGPELSTARDVQREIEITRALGSLNPDGGAGGAFGSFVKLHGAHIVAGAYPKRLLDAWDEYHENKEGGSENWSPDVLEDNQIFAVIVLGDGGRNLEHSELDTWQQAASIFWQLVHAIATAEMAIEFEHRDLHWGNVLISPRPPEIEPLRSATLKKGPSALSILNESRTAAQQTPSLLSASSTVNFLTRANERGRKVLNADSGPSRSRRNGGNHDDEGGPPTKGLSSSSSSSSSDFSRALEAQNAGIYATIIDFALSRVVLEPGEGIRRDEVLDGGVEVRQKRILAYDFDDEEIFEGKGDAQFDVYRDMRDLIQGDWHTFRPVTNVMWLSFFVEKLTATRKLRQLDLKPGKNYVGDEHRERYFYGFLRHCQRRIHASVEEVLEEAFDARQAAAMAKKTGRPVEDFLPQTAKEAQGSSSKTKQRGKDGGGGREKGAPKPLQSARSLLRWMRREVERLGDGFHAGDP